MDGHGDGKKKKGGRMRTVTFASPKDATDAKYQQGVKKLEEAFGTRGGYVLGEGALNKNDAMYMMEEDEKRRAMERARKEEEAARFKRMVVKERSLKGVQDEAEGVPRRDVGDVDADEKVVDGGEPVMDAVGRAQGNKRRKTAKELLRVKKVGEAEARDAQKGDAQKGDAQKGDAQKGDACTGVDGDDGRNVEEEDGGGLTSLFGEYDDSD